uniref:Uncharacterized protein n=1 Tax=Heliothis virescens TaxID=7102 RepID=A0A2A4K057_HELVI
MSSSLTNLPTTPSEPQGVFPSAAANISDENTTVIPSINPETLHPLTAAETDVYDNANSLQTHSFSGSSESMNVAGKGLDYSTEVHGTALNASDVEAIKKFLQEYASKALLPYMEKQISQLSEVVANRKGVSRSLLSATKRWFGTGKGGNTTGNSTVIYTSDCPELQLRRLGDLWFLCRQWQRAFDTYHTAKREFYADSAWLCYAGALEMAAISAFMAGDSNRKTHGYMEESIVTYLNTCRMVQYAVRATLLSVLCLSGSGLHGEAAKQLIRMTSEDSDLRSAMLLEQAALCFLSAESDVIFVDQQWVESNPEVASTLEELPLPLVEARQTSVMLLQVAQGAVPMIFKPTVDLYTDATDAEPLVPQGEPIQISVTLWNPMKISLILKDVELLWRFVTTTEGDAASGDEEVLSNEQALSAGQVLESNTISSQKIKSVILEGDTKKVLIFTLTPLKVGRLNIHGLAYKLVNTGEGGTENGNSITISGKVNLTPNGKTPDKRLQITVIPEAPCLQMTFSETSSDIISGEMRTIDVEFTNVGPVDMNDLYVAVSHPDCVNIVTDEDENDFKVLYDEKYRDPPTYSELCQRYTRYSSGKKQSIVAFYEFLGSKEAVELAVTPRRSLRRVDGEVVENMSLAVEIKNIFNEKGEDLSVEILEASLLSRQWSLTSLVAARGAAEALQARDKLHVVLRARRLPQPPPRLAHTRLKINHHDPDAEPAINVPPYSKFVLDGQHSYIDSPDSAIAQDTSDKRTGLIQSMFVLRWKVHEKTKGKTAVGQHCLWLDCFTKAISREREYIPGEVAPIQIDEFDSKLDLRESNTKTKKDNVVIFRLEHSNYINHNFNETKLCLVPVTLNIVNCYGVPVKVFIDMSKQKNRELSGELGWAGALSYGNDVDAKELGVSVNLDKFESKRVQVRGVCAAPGTYLVGSAFSVSTTGQDANLNVSNVSNNTSLLVVEQVA